LTRREGWSLIEMSYLEHNRKAWDRQAAQGSRWATPVGPESIRRAREGDPVLILTPNRPVPRDWLGDVGRKDVLCLASGGGQQAPLFAAAGARVVSFDLSEQQLDLDRLVAEREGLSVRCIKGDMADLSELDDAVFDLVFNPVSNVFVPDVAPVWWECYRVLRPGGELDLDTLSTQRRQEVEGGEPMEFSHSLEAQIGGQLAAGFTIIGFFEDWWDDEATPLNRLSPTSMATRARKPLT
jgi:SAM-dependent methyltransferase